MSNAKIMFYDEEGRAKWMELSIPKWATYAQFYVGLSSAGTYISPPISLAHPNPTRVIDTSLETKPDD